MVRRALRRFGLIVAALLTTAVAVLVLVLALASSSFFQRRLVDFGFSALDERYGVVGRAESAHLDLARLDLHLHGLSFADSDHAGEPFFRVDEVRVDLPWRALWSDLSIELVSLVAPRLQVQINEDGTSNLPDPDTQAESATGPSGPREIPIGALSIQDLTVDYVDLSQRMRVEVSPTTIELTGEGPRIVGPITLDDTISIQTGDHAFHVTELSGDLSFDGTGVGVEDLTLSLRDEALDIRLFGSLQTVTSSPRADLTFESNLDVAHVVGPFVDAVISGRVSASGTIRGPLDHPTTAVSVSADRLAWNRLTARAVTGELEASTEGIRIDTFAARIADGRVAASGGVLGPDGQNSLAANWQNVAVDGVLEQLLDAPPAHVFIASTGTLDLAWTNLDPREISVVMRHEGIGSQGASLTTLEGSDGTYRLIADQAIGRGGRLSGSIEAVAPTGLWGDVELTGNMEIRCDDLGVCRQDVDALPRGGSIGETLSSLHGRAVARFELDGSVRSPRGRGTVDAVVTGVAGLPPLELALQLSGDRTQLDVFSMTGRVGETTFTGDTRVDWTTGDLTGRLDGDLVDLPAFTSLVEALTTDPAPNGEALPWTLPPGEFALNVQLAGTIAEPRARTTLDGTLALEPLFPDTPRELPIRATLAIAASGSLLPVVTLAATVSTDALSWSETTLGPAVIDIAHSAERSAMQAEFPELGASASFRAQLGVAEPHQPFTSELRVTPTATQGAAATGVLSRLGELLDLPLTGDAGLSVVASGSLRDLTTLAIDAELELAEGRFGDHALVLRPPRTRLRYSPAGVTLVDTEVRIGESTVEFSGALAPGGTETLTVRGTSRLEDLVTTVAALPGSDQWLPELVLDGDLSLNADLSGWLDAPVLTGRLDIRGERMQIDEHPALEQLDLGLSYADGLVDVARLTTVWEGATVRGTGSVPLRLWADSLPEAFVDTLPLDGAASLHLQAESVTQRTVAAYVAAETLAEVDGVVDARLDIEAAELSLDAIRGSLTLDNAAFTVAGIPLNQRRKTQLDLDGPQLRVAAFDWGNVEDYVTVGGLITLNDENDPLADLTVTASVDLVTLTAFTPGTSVTGQADLIANIQGAMSDLGVAGTVELTNAGIRVAEPRLVVSSINGALALSGNSIVPIELRGELNGGPLTVTGELRHEGLHPQGTLTLQGRQVALQSQGLRAELDMDLGLVFDVDSDDVRVVGTTVLQRGDYRRPLSLTGGLLSAVDRRQQIRVLGLEEPTLLDTLQLDIQVATAEDILLQNNYLDASLSGDIRLGGTVNAPAVTGRVALVEGGRIRIGTRTYDIESGAIDLVDPAGIDPRLDIRARTRAAGYDISLAISGGQDDLETTFESDPVLPSESDIISVLLTGRTLSESADDPATAARDQALGLVSNELLGSAGRGLGLDVSVGRDTAAAGQVRFDESLIAGEVDPSTRLTVAKRLNDRVELILSRDLRESGLSWIVSYLARDNVTVRGLFSDDNDRGYEFLHALDFGAPARAERLVPASRPEQPSLRIVDIRFDGVANDEAETLRNATRVAIGDVFDFHRWQDDQDRLEDFYHERDYWEVNVHARREQGSSEEEVILGYDIEQGPRTSLLVDGYDLPRSVRDELETAWQFSVFDGFLQTELQAIAERSLRSAGHLEARVETEIIRTSDSDEPNAREVKTVRLRVSPGRRVEIREVQFSGSEVIDERSLSAFADATFAAGGDWGDPTLLEDALLTLYRSQGLLETTVTVGALRVEGQRAVLPVHIEEGRQFVIASVELEGITGRSEADVRAKLGFVVGSRYSDSVVEEGLIRLRQDYRRLGFNGARVSAESTVDPSIASVELRLTVQEGLQEILDEITVEGASRTHPSLVSTALALEPGQPVDLSAWNLARKRLYDTGVFRTVDVRAEPSDAPLPTTDTSTSGPQRTRARVLLEELPLYNIRYGLRVNDLEAISGSDSRRDFGLGIAADASRRNLLGRGVTVGSALRAGIRGQAGRAYVRTPRSFGLPIRSTAFVERSRAERGEDAGGFAEDLTTLSVEQRVELPIGARLLYSTTFDRNHSFEKAPANPDFPFDITINIVRYASNFVVDRRDNVFDATRGWFHSSHVEYGFEPGGGSVNFTKYLAQQYHHWNVGPGIVLASAGRLGLATGLGDTLIPSERFFAGGGSTVRGYAQDALGPEDFFGDAAGGNALLIANQEVRFPLLWRIRGVGFADVGNVFATTGGIALSKLAVGAGLGLRIETPVGLIRFDYGFALTRETDMPIGRLHFSIGQAF